MKENKYDRKKFKGLLIAAIGTRNKHDFAKECNLSRGYISRLCNMDEALSAPKEKTLDAIAKNAENGITLNQLREACGYDNIPEGNVKAENNADPFYLLNDEDWAKACIGAFGLYLSTNPVYYDDRMFTKDFEASNCNVPGNKYNVVQHKIKDDSHIVLNVLVVEIEKERKCNFTVCIEGRYLKDEFWTKSYSTSPKVIAIYSAKHKAMYDEINKRCEAVGMNVYELPYSYNVGHFDKEEYSKKIFDDIFGKWKLPEETVEMINYGMGFYLDGENFKKNEERLMRGFIEEHKESLQNIDEYKELYKNVCVDGGSIFEEYNDAKNRCAEDIIAKVLSKETEVHFEAFGDKYDGFESNRACVINITNGIIFAEDEVVDKVCEAAKLLEIDFVGNVIVKTKQGIEQHNYLEDYD